MSRFSKPLPAHPSLEQLQKQAKTLLKQYRAGDREAVERFRTVRMPRKSGKALAAVLADAQFLLAHEYGFESWAKLKRHVEIRSSPHGLSSKPPFYQIDWKTASLSLRQPMSSRDWDQLIDVMKEMRLTELNAGGQMSDEIMARVAELENLTRLNLGGSKRLTDSGLRQLSRMPQLVELELSDYPGGIVTDRGLESLRQLKELKRFQMCWQSGITDTGIANLSSCDKLESVDLLGSPTGDGALAALRGKSRLRHLKTGRQVSDAGLTMLRDFPVFRSWQGGEPRYDLMTFGNAEPNFVMLDGSITDGGLSALAELSGLFGLGFFWHASALSPNGLRVLNSLPNLGALACEGRLCDDTAMRHIGPLPKLRGNSRNRRWVRGAQQVENTRIPLGPRMSEPDGARRHCTCENTIAARIGSELQAGGRCVTGRVGEFPSADLARTDGCSGQRLPSCRSLHQAGKADMHVLPRHR
jgi:hypothetical protein